MTLMERFGARGGGVMGGGVRQMPQPNQPPMGGIGMGMRQGLGSLGQMPQMQPNRPGMGMGNVVPAQNQGGIRNAHMRNRQRRMY